MYPLPAKDAEKLFSTGYSDCTTCGGAGVIFLEMDGPGYSCPECHRRDEDFEELYWIPDRY